MERLRESRSKLFAKSNTARILILQSYASSGHDSALRRTWSSGKLHKAPLPPTAPPPARDSPKNKYMTKASVALSQINSRYSIKLLLIENTLAKLLFRAKNYSQTVWRDEAKRRHCCMWVGFCILIVLFAVAVIVLISKFTSGFSSNSRAHFSLDKIVVVPKQEAEVVDDNYTRRSGEYIGKANLQPETI